MATTRMETTPYLVARAIEVTTSVDAICHYCLIHGPVTGLGSLLATIMGQRMSKKMAGVLSSVHAIST